MDVRQQLINDDREKKRFSIVAAGKIIYCVLLNEYIVLSAWKDLIVGNYSILWEKAERRE